MNTYYSAYFLNLVAKNLISRFGTNLSNIVVVVPYMRSKLFLNKYLYQYAKIPLWSPKYKTIESLFKESSHLQICDNILLIIELYKTYTQVYNNHFKNSFTETLDEFFFFGEILLHDFDEIDKNNVNTKLLFGNIQNLSALQDNFSHLSSNQMQALMHHFKAFQKNTPLQNNFCNIWNILSEVYTSFKSKLREKKIAYIGMLMRQVMENSEILFNEKHYAFVGFNILNTCEEQLFNQLKKKASFYWDYDKYYLETEAGQFIKQNISKFGSALDSKQFNVFVHPNKKITFLSSFSESGQSAVIPQWINSLQKKSSFIQPDSAIVLCNEAILPTIIHNIHPNKVGPINITMEFPLAQTSISSFILILIEMQIQGYRSSDQSFEYKYILPVLKHPYTFLLFPNAHEIEKKIIKNNIFFPTLTDLQNEVIFTYANDTLSLIQYLLRIIKLIEQYHKSKYTYAGLYQESIFHAYLIINRLYGLFSTENLNINKVTFYHLLRKYLFKMKIPFNGEPLQGLQIMGILETRTLDFNNLLIFNTNEEYMPGNKNENTFIPQFIRKYFKMSTFEHHDALYAYYFYRLLTRANNITLVYTTNETRTNKAEMSRFLLQLLVNFQIKTKINRFVLQTNIITSQSQHLIINKDKFVLEKIKNKYDLNTNIQAKSLSTTALTCLISCSYRFYLEYIQELKSKNELTSKINNFVFGSIFHRSAKLLYQQIRLQKINSETLESYIQYPQRIENIVLKAFQKEFFKKKDIKKKDYNGEQLINLHIICKLLERLIQFDQKHTPFSILGLEYKINNTFFINNKKIRININGIIDRLQQNNDGTHSIIDYKTSHGDFFLKNLKELFNSKKIHIFQTFIYAMLYSQKEKKKPIIPALLYIQQANKKNYSPILIYDNTPINNFNKLRISFKKLLFDKIEELFNPNIPFQQIKKNYTCQYCNFKDRCNR